MDEEQDRLAALRRYAVLDTDPEQAFDDIVALASVICGTPMAAMSLIDDDRHWMKASRGLGVRELPRDWSFCARAIETPRQQMLVRDLTLDPRSTTNPLVTGEPRVRFYAGAPLVTSDGFALGALCVLDTTSRDLTEEQQTALATLSRQLVALLEARRGAAELARAALATEEANARAARASVQFQAIFDGLGTAILLADADGRAQGANPALCQLLDRPAADIVGRSVADITCERDRATDLAVVDRLLRGDVATGVREKHLLRADGTEVAVVASSVLVRDPDGQAQGFLIQFEPIGARRQAESELLESQSAVDGIITIDASGHVVAWNDGAQRLLGYDRHAMMGQRLHRVLPAEAYDAHLAGLRRVAGGGEPHLVGRTITVEAVRADGGRVPVELSLARWQRGPAVFFTGVLRDITERLAAETAREHAATHHPLTGLGNLALLRRGAPALLEGATAPVALLAVELTGLAEVSVALGSRSTEGLFRQVAQRLDDAADVAVFHTGGREFVLLRQIDGPAAQPGHLIPLGEDLLGIARGPYDVDGVPIELFGEVGIALAEPGEGVDIDELLRRAETTRGRAGADVSVWSPGGSEPSGQELALLGQLRAAIDNDEMVVHYQPVVTLHDVGDRLAVEALVRWQHPQRGLLPPGLFVPQAERTQLILPLTLWVLDETLRQRQRWAQDGLEVDVAVNLSPRVLAREDVVARVERALTRADCPPQRLTLEVTESALVHDPHAAAQRLDALRAMGVHLSLDDFGTGYTSLSMLRTFTLDTVKIDQSFVRGLTEDEGGADSAIVGAVIDLAHRLGLRVVAEGVEDAITSRRLHELGSDRQQGYLFARPLPPAEAEAWLRSYAGDGVPLPSV